MTTTAQVFLQTSGKMGLTFPHSTGWLYFDSIAEVSAWLKARGGMLGGFGKNQNGDRYRSAIVKTSKLPAWAKP
jgi:hypothetical protein